jgi:hypothetical protein
MQNLLGFWGSQLHSKQRTDYDPGNSHSKSVVYRRFATLKTTVHRLERIRKGSSHSARDTMIALAKELIPNLPDIN